MKVTNMVSSRGNKIANQFILEDGDIKYFQSYDTIIVKEEGITGMASKIYLDKKSWDYSVTTGKYRNLFLGEDKKTTLRKIKEGIYTLVDLNG